MYERNLIDWLISRIEHCENTMCELEIEINKLKDEKKNKKSWWNPFKLRRKNG